MYYFPLFLCCGKSCARFFVIQVHCSLLDVPMCELPNYDPHVEIKDHAMHPLSFECHWRWLGNLNNVTNWALIVIFFSRLCAIILLCFCPQKSGTFVSWEMQFLGFRREFRIPFILSCAFFNSFPFFVSSNFSNWPKYLSYMLTLNLIRKLYIQFVLKTL